MQKWEYCAVYQINQMQGWLTGVGMVYRGRFTDQGAVREELEHNQDALAQCISELGSDG